MLSSPLDIPRGSISRILLPSRRRGLFFHTRSVRTISGDAEREEVGGTPFFGRAKSPDKTTQRSGA